MIISFLRASRTVGRSLVLRPSFAPRLVDARALPVGAGAPSALVSARARFFATTRPAAAEAAAAEGTTEKKARKKPASSTGGRKKKTTAASTEEGGAKKKPAKKAAAKKGRVGARKTKKVKRVKRKTKPKVQRILLKDLRPPFKNPGTSWTNFFQNYIKDRNYKGSSVVTGVSEASKLWQQMSAEEKKQWTPTPEARAEFQQKRLEWYRTLSPNARRLYRKVHQKPSRRGFPSVYSTFTKDNYASVPGENFKEKSRAIKEKWDALTDAEKQELVEKNMRERQEIKEHTPPPASAA